MAYSSSCCCVAAAADKMERLKERAVMVSKLLPWCQTNEMNVGKEMQRNKSAYRNRRGLVEQD
jgi:hypothetical protein